MIPLWTAEDLRAATGGRFLSPFACTGLSIDTRTLRPGDLFVALVAEHDGHAHARAALAQGAAGVLIHDEAAVPPGAPALLVPDTLAALAALGRAGRDRFAGRAVAVTGSVGKTTTKEMLRLALAPFGAVHAARASYNNQWGLPLTLATIPPGADFLVAEIGMNTAGEIAPLAALARPHVATITTIAPAHLGRLGSMEAIAAEKATILSGLEPGGIAVLPADSPYLPILAAAAPGPVVTFGGAARQGDAVAGRVGETTMHFTLSAPGGHMASNALAALATLSALGLDPARAAAALTAFAPGAGRGEQRHIRGGTVLLLDESYNANTASLRAAIGVLATMPGERRVAVIGDMLELGDFTRAEHESLAPDLSRTADIVFACGPESRAFFDRLPPARQGAHAPDSAALAPIVASAVRPGDAVLVKGSLGTRMRVVVQALEVAA